MPDPFHLLVLVLCSLAFFIFGAFIAGGIISTSIVLTDEPANWVTAIGTVLAAIGTVSTLVFLSYQHMLDKNAKQKEAFTKSSQEALDAYVNTIDSFLDYLTDSSLDKDKQFAFITPTYFNLLAFEKNITILSHRQQAQAKFEKLHIHLEIFYFELKAKDLFTMSDEDANKILFSMNGTSWSSSVYALVIVWLKYVVPDFRTIHNKNFTKYGWHQAMIEDKYIYYLLALLVSTDIKLVEVDSVVNCINRLGNYHNRCRVEINELWFMGAVEHYPLLFAHLFLRSSGLEAVKTSDSPSIFYPRFPIYGPDDTWLCIDHRGGRANLTLRIPPALKNSRYIKHFENSEKIPNAGPVRMSY